MNVYPLSQAQKRIWYQQKKFRGSQLYNIGGTVEIQGIVDLSILKEAIIFVYHQNPALQLKFFEEDSDVYQYIDDEPFYVEEKNFMQEENPVSSFHKWCECQAGKAFSMTNQRLSFFAVFKISNKVSGYFIKIHHIVADGWSIKLLTDQVIKAYEDIIHIGSTESGPRPSYLDIISDEQMYLNSIACEHAKKFWKQKFLQHPAPGKQAASLNGCRKTYILESNVQKGIEIYLEEKKISLNTFFCVLVFLYLYKSEGRDDIILGMPLLGRNGRTERQIIGSFTNTMPFQYRVNRELTIERLMKEVSVEIRKCFVYQKYPCNLLDEELCLPRKGISRLYRICVNYYNTVIQNQIDGMEIVNREFYNGQQEYPLQIIIRHWNQGSLQLDFDYQLDIYQESEINAMFCQMQSMIYQIIKNNEITVKELTLIDEVQRMQYIYQNNLTEKVYHNGKTIINLFDKAVREYPFRTALSKEDEIATYKDLYELSNRAASVLHAAGIKKGDIVAIVPDYNFESIAAIIGVMRCGAVFLPIDQDTPLERRKELCIDSGAVCLLTDENVNCFKGCSFRIIDLMKQNEATIKFKSPKQEDTAYIIYTSGSMGKPKGVMVTHKNMMNYICWAADNYLTKKTEIMPLYSSFAFDFTLTSIFLPLISGNEVRIYHSGKNNNVFREILGENKSTIIKITPSHIPLVQDAMVENSSVHTVIVGGEDLKEVVCKAMLESFRKKILIYNEYGPTETTIGCMSYLYQGENMDISVPIGKPIANIQIYLLDHDLQPVPNYMLGEIYVGGYGVSKGYINNERETSERFLDNPFHKGEVIHKTGDLAYRNDNGDYIFRGRYDRQCKIRGYRVSLFEIETCIAKSGLVKDSYVTTILIKGTFALCAYTIGLKVQDKPSLIEFLQSCLPRYMIPEFFVLLQTFPLNCNGKIDTARLPKPLYISDAPKESNTSMYQPLMEILKELFPDCNVTANSDFYNMGGDSIKAILISTRLFDRGYELKVEDILLHPQIIEMATFIKSKNTIDCTEKILKGRIRCTPVTQWFLHNNFSQPGYYNQSVLLECIIAPTQIPLDSIFLFLIRHHDGLRINVSKSGLFYNNDHLKKEEFVRILDCRKEDTQIAKLIAERTDPVFNLQRDLLIRPYVILTKEKNYLYILFHHLVSDAISIRILLEDLSCLCLNSIRGEAMKLPEKSVSFQVYAENYWNLTVNVDEDNSYRNEFEKSKRIESKNIYSEACSYGETQTGYFELHEKQTRMILNKACVPLRLRPEEILIAALVRTYSDLLGLDEITIQMEGHGRDVLEHITPYRTIGWFTELFPVRIPCTDKNGKELLISIKENYREVLRKKKIYGAQNRRSFSAYEEIELFRFNYLGTITEWFSETFTLQQRFAYDDIGPNNGFPYIADVNVYIWHQRLCVFIRYGKIKGYRNQELTEQLQKNLIDLIQDCLRMKEQVYSPNDFDLIDLSQEEIDRLQ